MCLESTKEVLYVQAMKRDPTPTHPSHLRYELALDDYGLQSLEETFKAYAAMMRILQEVATPQAGANLVALHDLAYERVREQTGLPSRLVTLGLRDFATHGGVLPVPPRLPLDDKLFAIKGPSLLTLATVRGRVTAGFDVAGYSRGWEGAFPASLVAFPDHYEIHIGVTPNTPRTQERSAMNEGILSRMGRLIAGIANATIDKAEDVNKVAVVEQAIREIDAAAEEARADLGKAQAQDYRIQSRRGEIIADIASLGEKIQVAIEAGRDDLAKAGVARQIDLESQIAALDKALDDARSQVDEGQKALQAVLAARREAEERLTELKRSLNRYPDDQTSAPRRRETTDRSARASAAVSRVTGVPAGERNGIMELDELDRLHRERAIEARLALLKSDGKTPDEPASRS